MLYFIFVKYHFKNKVLSRGKTGETRFWIQLSPDHLLRSSWIVFCRVAMLASRAARPSLNAASSLVSKVEPDLRVQSDHTDSTSHWGRVESRSCRAGPTSVSVCLRFFVGPRDLRYSAMRSGAPPTGCCCSSVAGAGLLVSVGEPDESRLCRTLK